MKKLIILLSSIIVLVLGLSACQKSTGSAEASTYYVGTRGTFLPYTYIDENDGDKLTGYDVEVIREIDDRIPDVDFEFQTMTLDSCFVSLDAGQLDLIANQLVYNDERAQLYSYTQVPYGYAKSYIVVRNEENNISTLEDLQGKTICTTATGEISRLLNEFNETANPPIEIIYTEQGSSEALNMLATGRIDATFTYPATVKASVDSLGYEIKVVGEPVTSNATYFILGKGAAYEALSEKMDEALQSMIDDGTLVELSEKFLGGDYTTE